MSVRSMYTRLCAIAGIVPQLLAVITFDRGDISARATLISEGRLYNSKKLRLEVPIGHRKKASRGIWASVVLLPSWASVSIRPRLKSTREILAGIWETPGLLGCKEVGVCELLKRIVIGKYYDWCLYTLKEKVAIA